jgi:aspartate kinase
VAGFTANTQDELITTLGRGGSDYTGTLIGSSLKVDEIIIWTDVDGFMTADPKVEPEAIQLPSLSYEEASEMVYFGVKSMHPYALTPALEMGIPLRIRNFFNLENEGTLIQDKAKSQMTARALSIIRDVCLFTVSGTGLGGTPGNTAKIFSLLGQKNIDVLMISQGSSQATISFIIPKQYLEQAYSILEVSLLGTGLITSLNYEDNVCIIAVIGGGMKGTPGVAARIFKSVAESNVNVRMIAQGSSELNVSFVVKDNVGEKTIRALHKEFRLGARMNSNLSLNI